MTVGSQVIGEKLLVKLFVNKNNYLYSNHHGYISSGELHSQSLRCRHKWRSTSEINNRPVKKYGRYKQALPSYLLFGF